MKKIVLLSFLFLTFSFVSFAGEEISSTNDVKMDKALSDFKKKNEHKKSFKEKFIEKKIVKAIQKATAANPNASSGDGDMAALLSLIFGGVSLLLLLSGGLGGLLGIAAFILGIIALKRGTSKRTMAIIGVILGSVAVLFALLFLVLLGALFGVASAI